MNIAAASAPRPPREVGHRHGARVDPASGDIAFLAREEASGHPEPWRSTRRRDWASSQRAGYRPGGWEPIGRDSGRGRDRLWPAIVVAVAPGRQSSPGRVAPIAVSPGRPAGQCRLQRSVPASVLARASGGCVVVRIYGSTGSPCVIVCSAPITDARLWMMDRRPIRSLLPTSDVTRSTSVAPMGRRGLRRGRAGLHATCGS